MFGRFVTEVEVWAVVPDLHAVEPGENVACGVREFTGQVSGCVAEELPAFRVRGRAGDAELLERESVDDSPVTGGVHDVDLTVTGHLVEFLPSRMSSFGEVALLVAVSLGRAHRPAVTTTLSVVSRPFQESMVL